VNTLQFESQLQSLQQLVAELQRKVERLESKPKDNWLPAVLGRFKDDPEFDEIIRLGKEFRETGEFSDDEAQ